MIGGLSADGIRSEIDGTIGSSGLGWTGSRRTQGFVDVNQSWKKNIEKKVEQV